ncbi:MAG TPA: tyrosine--tRNA ligase [Planktothrix sp.]
MTGRTKQADCAANAQTRFGCDKRCGQSDRAHGIGSALIMEHQQAVAEHEDQIPADIMQEATELARGAEVLPGGATGLAQKLLFARKEGRPLRVKLGVDPTSSDLHVGHAVVLRKLRKFQDFGHQVVLIIGGFTAQIGDPSGRNSTRPELTAEQVKANAATYLEQVSAVLDLSKTEITNNADWLAPLTLKDLLRLASQVTVNQLLAKEAFGDRLEKQQAVAFHELFYPILQGYDSVAIKADVELGGTDQRFNILQGRELQPRYDLEPQLAMLLPLLEGTDGEKKMSKSYNNYIGLKDEPTDMYGKCMRIPDDLIVKYLNLATALTGKEIDEIHAELKGGGNPKSAKERLGMELVRLYHGDQAAEAAHVEWNKVHSQKQIPDEMPSYTVAEPTQLFRLLVSAGLVNGSGEAKRLILDGGVKLDGEQLKEPNALVEIPAGTSKILQLGRRKFVRLVSG